MPLKSRHRMERNIRAQHAELAIGSNNHVLAVSKNISVPRQSSRNLVVLANDLHTFAIVGDAGDHSLISPVGQHSRSPQINRATSDHDTLSRTTLRCSIGGNWLDMTPTSQKDAEA